MRKEEPVPTHQELLRAFRESKFYTGGKDVSNEDGTINWKAIEEDPEVHQRYLLEAFGNSPFSGKRDKERDDELLL